MLMNEKRFKKWISDVKQIETWMPRLNEEVIRDRTKELIRNLVRDMELELDDDNAGAVEAAEVICPKCYHLIVS